MSEKEIMSRLIHANEQYKESLLKVNNAKKQIVHMESELIERKILKEKIEEELRVYILKYPEEEKTLNQTDIERFKELLPGLLEKLKHE